MKTVKTTSKTPSRVLRVFDQTLIWVCMLLLLALLGFTVQADAALLWQLVHTPPSGWIDLLWAHLGQVFTSAAQISILWGFVGATTRPLLRLARRMWRWLWWRAVWPLWDWFYSPFDEAFVHPLMSRWRYHHLRFKVGDTVCWKPSAWGDVSFDPHFVEALKRPLTVRTIEWRADYGHWVLECSYYGEDEITSGGGASSFTLCAPPLTAPAKQEKQEEPHA